MRKGAALVALVVLGIGGAAAAAASGPSSPSSPLPPPRPRPLPSAPEPETEPEIDTPDGPTLTAGWYWLFVDWPRDGVEYVAFQKANRGNFNVRKVLGYPGDVDHSVVIFEVLEPLVWTLRGAPSPAPLGIDTMWTDLIPPPASEPESAWRVWVENVGKQTVDTLLEYDRQFQEWLDGVVR